MAVIKAMVVFQGGSNLPEDRFINTFHFNNETTLTDHRTGIVSALTALFNTPMNSNPALGSYLSPYIKRLAEIRTYDMTQSIPRVPAVAQFTLAAAPSITVGFQVPEEAAVVASFAGAAPVTPHKRGRVYLGPLNGSALNAFSSSTPTRVNGTMNVVVADVFKRLADTGGLGWCVYSPTTSTYWPIVSGWCDNALDTQRRRGPDASARTSWTKT